MEKLYSVRIIRQEDQAVGSEYIKQFWMFCGVYVREFILEYAEEMKDDQEVDCNIFLTEENMKECNLLDTLRAKKEIYIHIDDTCDLSTKEKRKTFGVDIKQQLLGEITELEDDINEVYDIFVKYDVAYTNYVTHLYLYQFDLEGVNTKGKLAKNQKEKCMEKYKHCLKDLYKSGDGFTGSSYKKFAYLNCGRKINRINRANRQRPFFNVGAIVREAHQLSNDDVRFSMGNVLAGLTGLTEYETERDAETYLHSAMNQESGQRHSAFIYYCLGHYYEQERHDWDMGWEEYQKMGSVVTSCNYRFNFKYGCKEFREGNYQRAWEIFESIYNIMETRMKGGWIQPLEMEYYYKCASILNEIQNIPDICIMTKTVYLTEVQVYAILETCLENSKFVTGFIGSSNRKQVQGYYKYKMQGHTMKNILGR